MVLLQVNNSLTVGDRVHSAQTTMGVVRRLKVTLTSLITHLQEARRNLQWGRVPNMAMGLLTVVEIGESGNRCGLMNDYESISGYFRVQMARLIVYYVKNSSAFPARAVFNKLFLRFARQILKFVPTL